MTVSNELISEITFALVAAKDKKPGELNDLKEILLDVHYALQRLTEESRRARPLSKAAGATSQNGN